MWGDQIHIKYLQNRPEIITFERSSIKAFGKFQNLSNIVTRTILIFFLTLALFNVNLEKYVMRSDHIHIKYSQNRHEIITFQYSSNKYICKF